VIFCEVHIFAFEACSSPAFPLQTRDTCSLTDNISCGQLQSFLQFLGLLIRKLFSKFISSNLNILFLCNLCSRMLPATQNPQNGKIYNLNKIKPSDNMPQQQKPCTVTRKQSMLATNPLNHHIGIYRFFSYHNK
jgi:hypothetical protein